MQHFVGKQQGLQEIQQHVKQQLRELLNDYTKNELNDMRVTIDQGRRAAQYLHSVEMQVMIASTCLCVPKLNK